MSIRHCGHQSLLDLGFSWEFVFSRRIKKRIKSCGKFGVFCGGNWNPSRAACAYVPVFRPLGFLIFLAAVHGRASSYRAEWEKAVSVSSTSSDTVDMSSQTWTRTSQQCACKAACGARKVWCSLHYYVWQRQDKQLLAFKPDPSADSRNTLHRSTNHVE